MLEFSKTLVDVTKTNPDVVSHFAIVPDGTIMVVTRFIRNKGYRLVFNLDGTVGQLGTKVNEATKLSNDDFVTFSQIQFSEVDDVI